MEGSDTVDNKTVTFADLFAGIGGFHLAFKDLGAKCVYVCEKSYWAMETYRANFGNDYKFDDDLAFYTLFLSETPDIVCAGFPCQPFSIAGKGNGFEDERSNTFHYLHDFIKFYRPKAFLLENVPRLVTHLNGRTFNFIMSHLEMLGYKVHYKVLRACDYGLPTTRQRVYIVGLRNDIPDADEFKFPNKQPLKYTMSDIFSSKCSRDIGYTIRVGGRLSGINSRHNWDTYLVEDKPRVLTIAEGAKMMGFPDNFKWPKSQHKAFILLGNSVAVDVVKLIGEKIIQKI